jgi:hypothetical protein
MFVFGVDVQSIHFQSNCQRYEMLQWTKHLVDIPFGSKCSLDVPLVDVRSRHPHSSHGHCLAWLSQIWVPGLKFLGSHMYTYTVTNNLHKYDRAAIKIYISSITSI